MFLEVSYAHQDCNYLIKIWQKRVIKTSLCAWHTVGFQLLLLLHILWILVWWATEELWSRSMLEMWVTNVCSPHSWPPPPLYHTSLLRKRAAEALTHSLIHPSFYLSVTAADLLPLKQSLRTETDRKQTWSYRSSASVSCDWECIFIHHYK